MESSKTKRQATFKATYKTSSDECYTPQGVYDIVLKYAHTLARFSDKNVLRPFYPNGDYQAENYKGKIVVDNPPFSKMAEIVKFYVANNIKFLLFANHLTLFNVARYATAIVVNAAVSYENKKRVATSFITNLCSPDIKVIVEPSLRYEIKEYYKPSTTAKSTQLDPDIVTANKLGLENIKQRFIINASDIKGYVHNNPSNNKAIFGGGYQVKKRVINEIEKIKSY